MRLLTVRQALQRVADNPEMAVDDIIALPVHELVCRTLFEVANGVQSDNSRTLSRANMAREMIFNRLVGKRKAGSHPATRQQLGIKLHDLTGELKQ